MPYAKEDYDPMIAVAANRSVVRIKGGHVGRLVYWSATDDRCTVISGGRHLRIAKEEVLAVVQEAP